MTTIAGSVYHKLFLLLKFLKKSHGARRIFIKFIKKCFKTVFFPFENINICELKFKGTVSTISSDPPCKEGNARLQRYPNFVCSSSTYQNPLVFSCKFRCALFELQSLQIRHCSLYYRGSLEIMLTFPLRKAILFKTRSRLWQR